jgi:MATE family multidrug resistance protein
MTGWRSDHGAMWRLALPTILANLTQPLLGIVDTAVIGNLSAAHIGAVAAGATVFAFLYWALAFLRMATTGFAAQAYGAGDHDEVGAAMTRAAVLAAVFGIAILALQRPIVDLAIVLISPSAEVETLTREYTLIRIWGAPAALANMAILGWLLGLQRAGTALALQIVINGVNIVLDLVLAVWLDMEVAGVAWATMVAQYAGLAAGLWVVLRVARGMDIHWRLSTLRDGARLVAVTRVNRDIFVRTLCVITAVAMFTAQGARMGDLVLAANGILVLFQMFLSHGLDGFAHAAEALVGNAVGARDRRALRVAVRVSTIWAALVAIGYTALYGLAGWWLVGLITDLPDVRAAVGQYFFWIILSPLISVWSFQLDGIFIGATGARQMRNAMLLAFAVYLIALPLLLPAWGNHGLWLAFMLFMVARAVTLAAYYPSLERTVTSARG